MDESLLQERQKSLFAENVEREDPAYLTRQLITYIGNKRSLLGQIGQAVESVKRKLGKEKLKSFDVFAGSGVVSRFLKAHSSLLASNDFEAYAAVAGRCYLRNRSEVDFSQLRELVCDFNRRVLSENFPRGFIEELYAPQCEQKITSRDRVFYTPENARRLDNYRRLIETAPQQTREMLLAPLLARASVHANTSGVFKGFHKNRHTGVGQFGGTGSDATLRIKGTIELDIPLLSRHECEVIVLQQDANLAAQQVKNLDLAYVDPPYNQHPYGSNYFMLNLLVDYRRPAELSQVSGIPKDWQRSGYNVRAQSLPLLRDLLFKLDAKFLLISFSDEGFISPPEMISLLQELGKVETIEIKYNAFRGSRSFEKRSIHVTEQLFLVERN